MRQNLAAIRHLEDAVLEARWTEGLVLRYVWFYGPGTSMTPGAEQLELVRKRKFPLVGDSGAVWSFIHVADVARLFAGEAGVVMMTEIRGASNAKAKRELAWQPQHRSWREGFAAA